MKSYYHCVYDMKFHFVLVTKYRPRCLTSSILDRIDEIISEFCERWEVQFLEFGGEADHVHLLLNLTPTVQPSKFINSLKTVTSRLIRKEYADHMKPFYWKPVLWSRAYCLLTAGGDPLETLREYIENQDRPT